MSCCADHKRLKRIERMVTALYQKAFPLPIPGEITITLISERRLNDVDFLLYKANWTNTAAGTDVVAQVLEQSVDGVSVSTKELAKDATDALLEEVQEGVVVDLSIRNKDNAGNLSDARTQQFTAADTIAPDAPGDFGGIELVSERHVDDAPPA
jgi:hypothetical protein